DDRTLDPLSGIRKAPLLSAYGTDRRCRSLRSSCRRARRFSECTGPGYNDWKRPVRKGRSAQLCNLYNNGSKTTKVSSSRGPAAVFSLLKFLRESCFPLLPGSKE